MGVYGFRFDGVQVQGFDNGNRAAGFVFDFDIQFSGFGPVFIAGSGGAPQGLIFGAETAGAQQEGDNGIAAVFIGLQGCLDSLELRQGGDKGIEEILGLYGRQQSPD